MLAFDFWLAEVFVKMLDLIAAFPVSTIGALPMSSSLTTDVSLITLTVSFLSFSILPTEISFIGSSLDFLSAVFPHPESILDLLMPLARASRSASRWTPSSLDPASTEERTVPIAVSHPRKTKLMIPHHNC